MTVNVSVSFSQWVFDVFYDNRNFRGKQIGYCTKFRLSGKLIHARKVMDGSSLTMFWAIPPISPKSRNTDDLFMENDYGTEWLTRKRQLMFKYRIRMRRLGLYEPEFGILYGNVIRHDLVSTTVEILHEIRAQELECDMDSSLIESFTTKKYSYGT